MSLGTGRVTLAHGAGGRETWELLDRLILSKLDPGMKTALGGIGTDELDDGATLASVGGHLVLTVDAFTVSPPFFPGGDIGSLAAAGAINDVLMMGGRPVAVLDSVVAEEGLPLEDLDRVVSSFLRVLRSEGVSLIGGDLKVMPRGQVDGVLITAVGVGVADRPIVDSSLREGDVLIVSGPVGEHGAAILAAQRGIGVESEELRSDSRPLTGLMLPLLREHGDAVRAAVDPTRGGLAGVLNEWASKTGLTLVVDEARIPVREPVRSYADMLGVDPLTLACEGVALLGVDPGSADEVLEFVRDLGFPQASEIGEVRRSERGRGMVLLRSEAGGLRILEAPSGEIVPRIC